MSRRAKWLAILIPIFAAIAISPYILGARWSDYRTASQAQQETSQTADTLKSQGKLISGSESQILESSLPSQDVRQADLEKYLSDLAGQYSYQLVDIVAIEEPLDIADSINSNLTQHPFRVVLVGPNTERDAMLDALLGSEIREDPLFTGLLDIQNPNYIFTTLVSVNAFDNGSNTTRLEIDLAAFSTND